METFEIIVRLISFIVFLYHVGRYNVNSPTPYHGIMALIWLLIILIGGKSEWVLNIQM